MRSRKLRGKGEKVAAAMLQWGRDLAVTETVTRTTLVGGFRLVLQWGRDLAVTETNGAKMILVPFENASMGP